MRIISIAVKDLLVTLKDKKALALIILMPIALILVLGISLSSMFSQGGVSINKFDIVVVDKDGGEYSKHFVDFLKSDDIRKMIELKDMTEAEAMDKVKKGDIPALIVLPRGYSEKVAEGEEAKIQVYTDPGSPMRVQIVESLVKSYAGVGSAVQGAVDATDTVFSDYSLDGHMILPKVMEAINETDDIEFKASGLQRKKGLSAIQYYSAAMLVMYIMFVGMLGTISIIQEREQKTLMRLMSTAVSNATILTGKLLGLFLLGIFDVAALIIFTRFVFNVDWGNSLAGLVILSAAMIFAASGLAMFIATLFKTSKAVDSANPVIIMVMSFLGGSMFPLMAMPPVLQSLSRITLNNWALRGYLSLMLGSGLDSIVTPIIVLTAMGAVLLGAGISRLRLQ